MPSNTGSFLITGCGRSGTKFLAHMLNRSSTWTVLHEPDGGKYVEMMENGGIIPEAVKERFRRPFYGEVNSRLRWIASSLQVAKLGVILRNPKDIWLSIANRRNPHKWHESCQRLRKSHKIVLELASREEVYTISFNSMTTNPLYLRQIANFFGILDVVYKQEDGRKKINPSREYRYNSLDRFSNAIRDTVSEMTEEFNNYDIST